MVFQNYALYPHLSAHDNIGFSLSCARCRKRSATGGCGRPPRFSVSPRFSTAVRASSRAGSASGSRWAGRSSASRRLPDGRAAVQPRREAAGADAHEVMHIQHRLGVATMYVTHDQTEAMTMGDRVAVMRDGVLQQLAAPQELYDRPANVFVAVVHGLAVDEPLRRVHLGLLDRSGFAEARLIPGTPFAGRARCCRHSSGASDGRRRSRGKEARRGRRARRSAGERAARALRTRRAGLP